MGRIGPRKNSVPTKGAHPLSSSAVPPSGPGPRRGAQSAGAKGRACAQMIPGPGEATKWAPPDGSRSGDSLRRRRRARPEPSPRLAAACGRHRPTAPGGASRPGRRSPGATTSQSSGRLRSQGWAADGRTLTIKQQNFVKSRGSCGHWGGRGDGRRSCRRSGARRGRRAGGEEGVEVQVRLERGEYP